MWNHMSSYLTEQNPDNDKLHNAGLSSSLHSRIKESHATLIHTSCSQVLLLFSLPISMDLFVPQYHGNGNTLFTFNLFQFHLNCVIKISTCRLNVESTAWHFVIAHMFSIQQLMVSVSRIRSSAAAKACMQDAQP